MYFKHILAAIVATAICFHQGFSLSCLNCISYNSWEHCNKEEFVENCTVNFGESDVSCIKLKRVVVGEKNRTKRIYMKRCFETEYCNQEFCTRPTDTREKRKKAIGCNVYCCKHNYCNNTSKEALSVVMVTVLSFAVIPFVCFNGLV